jgi:DNA-directed RNA polymerase sigma subunit (sigma70/sigma32)
MNKTEKIPVITDSILAAAKSGDDGAKTFILDALKHAVHWQIHALTHGGNLPPNFQKEDLSQEGYKEICAAIQDYDATRGIKFTTFAISRIRFSLINILRKEYRTQSNTVDVEFPPDFPDGCDMTQKSDAASQIEDYIYRLRPAEIALLTLNFGLDGIKPHRIDQCATFFGWSKSKTEKMKASCLQNIRGIAQR